MTFFYKWSRLRRQLLPDRRRGGVSPGVLCFLVAVIGAVAAMIFAISQSRPPEAEGDPGGAATFKDLSETTAATQDNSREGRTIVDVTTAGTPVIKADDPLVEVLEKSLGASGSYESGSTDGMTAEEELKEQQKRVAEIFAIAEQVDAAALATSDYVRGSALKTAADRAVADGKDEEALNLLRRTVVQMGTAAFNAALAGYQNELAATGLSGLAETPTPRWIEAEAQIETARSNLAAGRFEAAIDLIKVLKTKIPELRTNTLDSWLITARAAAQNGQDQLAVRFYIKSLGLDKENAEARQYLFSHLFKAGEIFENTVGMRFAFVPPGTFMMGSPETEAFRDADEILHEVTITNGFFMGVHEVTQEQWRNVMNEPMETRIDDPAFFGSRLPVHSVSWENAVEFCKRLSDREGRTYRLPTEAEWEFAVRAGTETPFSNGQISLTFRDANVYDPSGTGSGLPLPVGAAGPANPLGLFDVHGNVWEWTSDWSGPYSGEPETDPTGVAAEDLPSVDVATRVVRGGSFIDDADKARSANRWEYSPAAGNEFIGFRVVLEVGSFDEYL